MAAKDTRNNKRQHRPRRRFTEAFRADVVKLCESGSESISDVCKRLDLTESAVRGWVKKAGQEGPRADILTASEQQELQRLRRDNKQLRVEREILKKAATFFAKENP